MIMDDKFMLIEKKNPFFGNEKINHKLIQLVKQPSNSHLKYIYILEIVKGKIKKSYFTVCYNDNLERFKLMITKHNNVDR